MKTKISINSALFLATLVFSQAVHAKGFNMNDFGKGFSDGMAEKVKRRDEVDSEVAIYSAKMNANSDILMKQYDECRKRNKYTASPQEINSFRKRAWAKFNKAENEIEIQNKKFKKNEISQEQLDDRVKKIKDGFNESYTAISGEYQNMYEQKDAPFVAYCDAQLDGNFEKLKNNVQIDTIEQKQRRAVSQLQEQQKLQEQQQDKIRQLEGELNDIKIKKCGGSYNC